MIAFLKGVLSHKAANELIVDVHGVGYQVLIPLSTYYELGEPGAAVSLHIHTHVREDALQLFGFLSEREKRVFQQLLQVSGIGPRLGLTILSGLPLDEFLRAVMQGDVRCLSGIPGVGKKTAERIVLETRDRLASLAPEVEENEAEGFGGVLQKDVVSALVNLGYPRNRAESAVGSASKEEETDRFEVLLKRSLRKLAG